MNPNFLRSLAVFGASGILAIAVGYFMAMPLTAGALMFFGVAFLALIAPVLLRWHHWFLLFSWNATVLFFFLPGQLPVWIPMAFISLGCSILTFALSKEKRLPNIPLITAPLLLFLAVMVVTIWQTGGIGLRALGSDSFGGKRYLYLFAAVFGGLVLSWHRIPPEKAKLALTIFMLSGVTSIVGTLIYQLGPALYPLLSVFPLQMSGGELSTRLGELPGLRRFQGVGFGAQTVVLFMLVRYGIAGILSGKHLGRMAILVGAFALSLLGGFRSTIVLTGLLFGILFVLERMHRTALLPIMALSLALAAAAILPFADKLPLAVQRSLTLLPLELDTRVRMDAQLSFEWRIDMWKVAVRDIPRYLWIGKGFVIDPTDLYLYEQGVRRGFIELWEGAMAAGDYHSGPLTVILTFGLPGAIGFLWLLTAGAVLLVRNHRYGDPALKTLNCGLLALYLARALFFLFVYGSIHSDLAYFTGLIGLSIALNGYAKQRAPALVQAEKRSEDVPTVGLEPAIARTA